MYCGDLNREAFIRTLEEGSDEGSPMPSMLGIGLNDATAVGYYFAPLASAADRSGAGDGRRRTFTPDRKPYPFRFTCDPAANGGTGRVTYTIDGKEGGFDLSPGTRSAGAAFDSFGLATVRRGGNSVELYFDDLSYTVKREPGAKATFHPQTIVERPYPKEASGRAH